MTLLFIVYSISKLVNLTFKTDPVSCPLLPASTVLTLVLCTTVPPRPSQQPSPCLHSPSSPVSVPHRQQMGTYEYLSQVTSLPCLEPSCSSTSLRVSRKVHAVACKAPQILPVTFQPSSPKHPPPCLPPSSSLDVPQTYQACFSLRASHNCPLYLECSSCRHPQDPLTSFRALFKRQLLSGDSLTTPATTACIPHLHFIFSL